METMVLLSLDDLRKIVREEVETAVKKVEARNDLPPVLTRVQMMELLQISHEKASELLGRSDFPTIKEAGGVKIRTAHLFKWLDDHTLWSKEMPERFRSIS